MKNENARCWCGSYLVGKPHNCIGTKERVEELLKKIEVLEAKAGKWEQFETASDVNKYIESLEGQVGRLRDMLNDIRGWAYQDSFQAKPLDLRELAARILARIEDGKSREEIEVPCCPHPKERHTRSVVTSSDESYEGFCQDCKCDKGATFRKWPGYRG